MLVQTELKAEKWKRVTSAAEWHKAAARGLARLFLAGGLHITQLKGEESIKANLLIESWTVYSQ